MRRVEESLKALSGAEEQLLTAPSKACLGVLAVELHAAHRVGDTGQSGARPAQLEELDLLAQAFQGSSADRHDFDIEVVDLAADGVGR